MRVLAVGGGAREHAIVEALVRSGAEVFSCMKNSNPGISRSANKFALVEETDVPKVVQFARTNKVELAVIGPEAPLEAGLSDALRDADIPTASPSKGAARIETSKSFMRELLAKHKIMGSVKYEIVDSVDGVRSALRHLGAEIVMKPIGLTGGKGVKVFGEHMLSEKDVLDYAEEIFSKRIGGSAKLVVEEKLVGEEFTVQAFCDGKNVVPMPAVQDHKRAYEGDQGPNTGGMGSYSQQDGLLPFLHRDEYEAAVEVMKSVLEALRKEGSEYRGTLYGQFMLTSSGPKVIEFNARFGDPEAMNVLSLLDSDFVAVCSKMASSNISRDDASFMPKASVCKYVVPEGYGTKSIAGEELTVDESAIMREGALIYYANVNEKDGKIYTTSSRSVGIVGIAGTVEEAERIAENGIKHVQGRIHVRHDIAKKAMLEAKARRMDSIRR